MKPCPQKPSPVLEIVPKESWLEKVFVSKKKKRLSIIQSKKLKIKECEKEFEKAILNHNQQKDKAHSVWSENERLRAESIDYHNKKIDEWEKAYINGKEKAVSLFAKELLKSNNYDINVITQYRINYVSNEKKLIVEFDMKSREKIFYCESYRYMIQADEFRPIQMKARDINERTKDLMTELVGATFAVIFKNDTSAFFSIVIVSGYHNDICCVTGKAEKEKFLEKDFNTESGMLILKNFWIKVYSQIARGVKPIETITGELET